MFRFAVLLTWLLAFWLQPVVADAGLLGKLGRMADNAGDAGGASRKADGLGGTDLPDTALRAIKDPNTTPLALGVDADGTVRLTDELGRQVVLPVGVDVDAALKAASNGARQVAVVVDAKALAKAGDVATALAERGALKLWHGKKALPLRMSNGRLSVEPRPGLVMPIVEPRRQTMANAATSRVRLSELAEVQYALNKTVNRGTVVVAELGAASKGPRRVGFGDWPSGKAGETVTVTRDDLLAGFSGNRGGTVILSGRVRDGAVLGQGGPVPLEEVRKAAAAADVHLVILNGPAKAAHKALAQASTFGDLLTGIAPKRGAIAVNAQRLGENRVRLSMAPEATTTAPASTSAPLVADDVAQATIVDDVAQVAVAGVEIGVRGIVHGLELDTRDRSYEQDLSMRLIPGVPYWVHVLYALNLIVGLYGSLYAWRFWRRLWPMAPRLRRIALAHIPRFLVFLLLFLPLTGIFWAIVALFASIGHTIMALLRLIGLVPRKAA